MYEVKGFTFVEKDGEILRMPLLPGLLANTYDEVKEVFKEIGIDHYMFTLVPCKEV